MVEPLLLGHPRLGWFPATWQPSPTSSDQTTEACACPRPHSINMSEVHATLFRLLHPMKQRMWARSKPEKIRVKELVPSSDARSR